MKHYYKKQIEDRARYLHDTQNHRMTIVKDDGVFRHIRMSNPRSSAYHFNVTTFAGYLVFTGDMGSYTFSRTRDMFEFMRIDWTRDVPTIDYRYWAQKAEAQDTRTGGCAEFDEDGFAESIKQAWADHQDTTDFHLMSSTHQSQAKDAFKFEVLDQINRFENETMHSVISWSYWDGENYTSPFSQFYEDGPFKRHTLHFKWACWAIAETIRAYDLGGDRFTRQAAADARVLGARHVQGR